MKKNNNTPNLEELLGQVEHAGRDARRQQQLAQMIEQMAAEEAAAQRSTFKKWTLRAVAATVTLFVVTSVWQWSRNDTPSAPTVAQAPVVRPTEPKLPQTAPMPANTILPASPSAVKVTKAPATPAQPAPVAAEETQTLEPETPAVTETPEAIMETFKLEEPTWAHESHLAELTPSDNTPDTQEEAPVDTPIATPEKTAKTTAVKPSEKPRRSIFSFFEAEPSLMEGTTLAFNLL